MLVSPTILSTGDVFRAHEGTPDEMICQVQDVAGGYTRVVVLYQPEGRRPGSQFYWDFCYSPDIVELLE